MALIVSNNRGDYRDGGGTQIGGYDSLKSSSPTEYAGKLGEKETNCMLRKVLRKDEYLLANVLIPTGNNRRTEIDCILISRKGIFCIETKKWVGHISGTDESEYWYQEYDDDYLVDQKHINPVKQNISHSKCLFELLEGKRDVFSAVIFVGDEDLSGIKSCCTYSLYGFVQAYRKMTDDKINEKDIETIKNKLEKYVATPEELEEYRELLEKRYKDN